MTALKVETIPVAVAPGEFSELTRVYRDRQGLPVLMLHGLMEDRRVFLPEGEAQGLARFLAEHGYDVFVAELRGRRVGGKGMRASTFGLHQAITQDLPAILRLLEKHRPDTAQLWVSHGWGGVLMSSFLARNPAHVERVQGIVHFAAKRTSMPDASRRNLRERLFWGRLMRVAVKLIGYVPATGLKLGCSNEPASLFRDSLAWLDREGWVDPQDGFDYAAAMQDIDMPPSLYFATLKDGLTGHFDEVRAFMREQGHHNGRMVTLGRKLGNRHNYGPTDMLTHRDAAADHFPWLLQWLGQLQ